MKKIITAINNPILNERLKKENNIEIITKDLQYKEAIIEVLEKNKVDLLILIDTLPGEMKIEELIKKIKVLENKIKIIYIFEIENKEREFFLKEQGIENIYCNKKINIEEIIYKINNMNDNSQEELKKEIKELKEIILNKNIDNNIIIKNNKNNINFKKNRGLNKISEIKKKIINNRIINNKIIKSISMKFNKTKETIKIISIFGNCGSGKSIVTINIAYFLKMLNKKVLIIDYDLLKQDIYTIFGLKDESKEIKKYKIKKVNKEMYLLSGKKIIIKNNKNNQIEKIDENLINEIKEKFDYILLDIGSYNQDEDNEKIIRMCDINLILMESNLLGIKETKKIINKYIHKWKIETKRIFLIENKSNKYDVDKEIIKACFNDIKILGKIKLNLKYNNWINNNYKKINIKDRKKIKKENIKILSKIIK